MRGTDEVLIAMDVGKMRASSVSMIKTYDSQSMAELATMVNNNIYDDDGSISVVGQP